MIEAKITPILEQKQSLADMMNDVKTKAWIFEKPFEKLIVAGAVLWSVYSLVRFIVLLLI